MESKSRSGTSFAVPVSGTSHVQFQARRRSVDKAFDKMISTFIASKILTLLPTDSKFPFDAQYLRKKIEKKSLQFE